MAGIIVEAKPGSSQLHPLRAPSSHLSPRLQLGMNQLLDFPWLGPRPGSPASSRAPVAWGFHIKFECYRISVATGFHPSHADSRFRGGGQPVHLVYMFVV